MKRGAFITVEGIDGCGKTTQADFIEKYLTEQGVSVTRTREPGGTEIGERLREILLGVNERISKRAELLMFFTARVQHLDEKILPALDCGDWVLCERFTDSTYAYQSGGRGRLRAGIATLEKLTQRGLQPDLTLLLDVSPEIGIDRVSQRSFLDRFEKESFAFSEAVRDAYLKRANEFKNRIKVINADRSLEEVQAQIQTELQHFIENQND